MIETSDLHYRETIEVLNSVQSNHNEQDADSQRDPGRKRWIGQVLRFGLVGGLNTIVDLLILNMLLLLIPTSSTRMILIYSAIAYSLGAVNSFLLNKYWTFGYRQRTTWREVVRFIVTTLCGIGWSSIILWLASSLWVFVNKARKEQTQPVWGDASVPTQPYTPPAPTRYGTEAWGDASVPTPTRLNIRRMSHQGDASVPTQPYTPPAPTRDEQSGAIEYENEPTRSHSMSVVLPAYNEEQVIANTVFEVLHVLNAWRMDFEILVVNDGSTDQTGEIVEALALTGAHSRVRLITHATNEGYGASLVSGFAAATKELVFFMDSDGQFDIRDLQKFFPLIDTYDAVIGYRIDRQDSWMRKLNAWGWKQLIGWVLGVHVRDVDCAFKLLHTEFLRRHPLETRGAMINAELLYRLTRVGCTYKEVGVNHLPRLHGRATGARLSVILRAFRELFVSAREWHRQEQRLALHRAKRELPTGS